MTTATPPKHDTPSGHIRSVGASDPGVKRQVNEDAHGALETEHFRLYLVADGLGGPKRGGVAANLALNTIKNFLKRRQKLELGDLREAIKRANREVFQKASADAALAGMGTTVVGLAVIEQRVMVCNVGNSRAYRIREGKVARLTIDNTLVQELIDSGSEVPAAQGSEQPVSHMLTRSVGTKAQVEIDCAVIPEPAAPGDVYLLCTDGLYDLVLEGEFVEILSGRTLDEAAQLLIARANERGGHDNVTIMLVSIEGSASDSRQHSEPSRPFKKPQEPTAPRSSAMPRGRAGRTAPPSEELPIPPEAKGAGNVRARPERERTEHRAAEKETREPGSDQGSSEPPAAPEAAPPKSAEHSADALAVMLEKKRKEIRERLLAKEGKQAPSDTDKTPSPTSASSLTAAKRVDPPPTGDGRDPVKRDIENLKRALSSIKPGNDGADGKPAEEKKDVHADLKARIAALSQRVAAEKERAVTESESARKRAADLEAAKEAEARKAKSDLARPGAPGSSRESVERVKMARVGVSEDTRPPLPPTKGPPRRPLLTPPPPPKSASLGRRIALALFFGLTAGGIVASQFGPPGKQVAVDVPRDFRAPAPPASGPAVESSSSPSVPPRAFRSKSLLKS
jgi:PPM family protein phosphatase